MQDTDNFLSCPICANEEGYPRFREDNIYKGLTIHIQTWHRLPNCKEWIELAILMKGGK